MRAVTSKSNLRFLSVRINPESLSRRAGHGLLQRFCTCVSVLETASQGRGLSGTLSDTVFLHRLGPAAVPAPCSGDGCPVILLARLSPRIRKKACFR